MWRIDWMNLISKSQVQFPRYFHHGQTVFKTIPNNLKGKSSSSQEWLTRHLNDPYVKKAQELNYRARSAFKLIEIDDKCKILRPGFIVVECGAAPGAWSQIAVKRINSDGIIPNKPIGKLIGIDLLPIEPLPGAHFLPLCDFTTQETQLKIKEILFGETQSTENIDQKRIVDVVLSDMAPNATGIQDVDNARICKLVRTALDFALEFGKPGSHFLVKVWAGSELKSLENDLKTYFKSVENVKPKSSRNDSSEIFLFAKSMKS